MAIELAAAYVTIYPKTEGFGKAINQAMGQAGLRASDTLGATLKKGMGVTGVAIGNLIATGITKCASTISASIDSAISRYDTLSNFSNVMGNLGIATSEADKARDKLSKGLEGLPTTLQDGVSAVQRFTSANSDIDKSTDMFLALNNAILAGGASTQVQASALEQMSQAYARGKMDMIEWRSVQTAMPAQMKQVAQSMGLSTDALGEGLRNGTISMDKFMDSIIKLNEEGGDGFSSLQEQAKTATGGIATNLTLIRTRTVAGLAKMIETLDSKLKEAGLSTIGETLGEVASKVSEVFDDMSSWLDSWDVGGYIKKFEPLVSTIEEVGKAVAPYLKDILDFFIKVTPYIASFVSWLGSLAAKLLENKAAVIAIVSVLGILKLGSFVGLLPTLTGLVAGLGGKLGVLAGKIRAPKTALAQFGDTAKKAGKLSKGATKGIGKLGSKLVGFAAAAGALLVVSAAFWLLSDAAVKLAAAGPLAIAVMAGMVLAIGGLVALMATFGEKLTVGTFGMLAFGAALLLVSAGFFILSQAAIALSNSGGLAVGILAGMIIAIAALVVIFALFGPALNAAIPGMIVFGAVIAAIVLSLTALTLAVTLLTAVITNAIVVTGPVILAIINAIAAAVIGIVTSIGEQIQGIIESTGEAIEGVLNAIGDNISKVITSITDGISDIITAACDGIQGIIDSIGDAISGIIDSMTGFVNAVTMLGLTLPMFANYGPQAAIGLAKFSVQVGKLAFKGALVSDMDKFSKAIMRISSSGTGATTSLQNIQTGIDKLPTSFESAATKIENACNRIKKTINSLHLKIPRIQVSPLPHFEIKNKTFDFKNGKTPQIKVNWYKEGGVFSAASLVGIGEAGPEAVIPLNKKTFNSIGKSIADAGSTGGQNNITINLNYSADADANQMVLDIARGLRRLNMVGA